MNESTSAESVGAARERMIETAEHLFAEQGLSAVSLRMVGQHAGQKNNSAAQYHFGSKEGLVDAVLRLRSSRIEARRAELLSELTQGLDGRNPDVRSLVRLLVHPLAESPAGEQRRTHYLRFLANATDHYSLTETWQVGQFHPPSYQATVQALRRLLPGLPDEVFERRIRWVSRVGLRLLADHEQAVDQDGDNVEPTAQVLADVVEMMVALFLAPVSTD